MTRIGAPVTLRLFGTPEIIARGAPLALNNQKARALLFYLAAAARPHTRDHLATLLWGEATSSAARHSLRSSLYRLRQALRASHAEGVLTEDHDQLCLHLADEACDVITFRRLLAEGDEAALSAAVALYRGPLLQGFTLGDAPLFEEWSRLEEAQLCRAYVEALDRLATWAEAREAWPEAIGYVERAVRMDPLAEAAQRRLIALYGRSGAIGQAVRCYQEFEATLRQDLGLSPSLETQTLIDEILRPPGRLAPAVEAPARRPARRPPTLPFVGRDEALARLLALSQEALVGRGVTVLLQGEGGIGKSRLLDELADRLSGSPGRRAWTILRGTCSPFDDLLSYGPFIEALPPGLSARTGDLADLPPDAARPTAALGAASQARENFTWRVLQTLRAMTARGPLLLTIDDLQWASSSTLNLFGFLAMRLHDLPLMLVGTAQRAQAIPALQRLITLGRRRGELHLFSLGPLPPEAVAALLRAYGVSPASVDSLAGWLHERSGGSPFILAEILAQMQAEAILAVTGDEWRLDAARWLRWRARFTLPETTHDLVAWRLANLSPDARHLLDVLAVAGLPLPHAALRESAALDDRPFVQTIDDLTARGLVRETPDGALALPHHLLRETLLHRLSHLRRRVIHRQLAEVLEAHPVLPVRQLARHAVLGEDVPRARRYGLQALADLLQDYSGVDTADFLHHLHDLLAPTASPDEHLQLTRALGRLHQSLGHLEAAAAWHRQSLDIARQMGGTAEASACFEMAELALVRNDYRAAATEAQAGLERMQAEVTETAPHPLMGRGHRLLGAALAMEGSDLPAAESHLEQAVAAHRLADNPGDLCATLFELGNVAAQRGQLARALDFYDEAARAAEAGRVHYYLALARNNFAYHSLLLGRPEAARRAAAQGLKVAEAYEMLGALLHLFSTQGEVHLYLAEWAAASEAFQRGLALAEELGSLERQAGYRAGLALAARGHSGDLGRATSLLEEALALIVGQGYWHLQTRILLWRAETLLLRGRVDDAWPHLDTALATARTHGRALLLTQGERLRARLLAAGGDWPAARAAFAQALELGSGLDIPLEAARTQAAWGQAALRHSPAEGRALLAAARAALAAHDARAELASLSV